MARVKATKKVMVDDLEKEGSNAEQSFSSHAIQINKHQKQGSNAEQVCSPDLVKMVREGLNVDVHPNMIEHYRQGGFSEV
jgi:hypothetical protein